MDHKKIGNYIAACRKKRGLTQQDLAEKLGITNKAVSKWETGQGMPDISILMELSELLEVPVDSLLTGEEVAAEYVNVNSKGIWDKIRTSHYGIYLTKWNLIGGICLGLACILLLIQVWYLVRGSKQQLEYIADWIFYGINAAIIVLAYTGGICVGVFRKYCLKKWVIALISVFFVTNIFVGLVWPSSEKEVISISSDRSSMLVLKINKESGKATVFRSRTLCFVRPADVFPYTVKDDVKIQWLTGDVCALTYQSTEDNGIHQYVATYGDRGGGISYYYVTSAALGTWRAEGKYEDYTIELSDGPEGSIQLETPMGEEIYEYEECLQYGTLAIVFPKDDPKWTLSLNQDCKIEAGETVVSEGGTLSLCRVSMDKTAPVTVYRGTK